jgi:hypothetical protein
MNRYDHDHENDRFSNPLSAYKTAPVIIRGVNLDGPVYSKPEPISKTKITMKKTLLKLPVKPAAKSLVSIHDFGRSFIK